MAEVDVSPTATAPAGIFYGYVMAVASCFSMALIFSVHYAFRSLLHAADEGVWVDSRHDFGRVFAGVVDAGTGGGGAGRRERQVRATPGADDLRAADWRGISADLADTVVVAAVCVLRVHGGGGAGRDFCAADFDHGAVVYPPARIDDGHRGFGGKYRSAGRASAGELADRELQLAHLVPGAGRRSAGGGSGSGTGAAQESGGDGTEAARPG